MYVIFLYFLTTQIIEIICKQQSTPIKWEPWPFPVSYIWFI